MPIPLYQVDAFTAVPFRGNPAAICPLTEWLPDELLQAIAAENNLAETAYFVPQGEGFHLRWFTPSVEVDLCGHATLAAADVICRHVRPGATELSFQTRSGELRVTREGGRYTLDFPARPPRPVVVDQAFVAAVGGAPESVLVARDHVFVYRTAGEVRALKPDLRALQAVEHFAVIVTAPGDEEGIDFVSRFFAPLQGIDEDPVTGSAHCTLIPYWAERLGKSTLRAKQVSARGGDLWCELAGDRVKIAGEAVEVLRGELLV